MGLLAAMLYVHLYSLQSNGYNVSDPTFTAFVLGVSVTTVSKIFAVLVDLIIAKYLPKK